MAPPGLTVAVRALAAFTAQRGDLDTRYLPTPTALEGIEGHRLLAARRGPAYLTEVPLSGHHGDWLIRGRADGYDPTANCLEEFKTHRGALDRQPENHRALHWAQLEIYGWLLCAERGLTELELALVYWQVDRGEETRIARHCTADELQALFAARCELFAAWARQEARHRRDRDAVLSALRFPHDGFRPGQRVLAEAVWRAARQGRCVTAQAPTGVGKTMATLYPQLRAMPAAGLDKVAVLTPKTSGRALALSAVQALRAANPALRLRTLELVARDKACVHPDKACHGASCPLASGFYDRLPAARGAAASMDDWRAEPVRACAAEHAVCPYYLAQALLPWADVVVGDVNHQFDTSAMLHAGTVLHPWKVSLLIDEAHNLVDRARGMYSAQLSEAALRACRGGQPPATRKLLNRALRRWQALRSDAVDAAGAGSPADDGRVDVAWPAPPESLLEALRGWAQAVLDEQAEHPDSVDATTLQHALDVTQTAKLADRWGEHSLCDVQVSGDGRARVATLHLRNVSPAPFLQARWAAVHSAVLYSATLTPPAYHAQLLGLPDNTVQIEVPSPFDAGQLAVHVARRVSTRYADRARSLPLIVEAIARQYAQRPGNYLAFFSSFDYLQRVADALAAAAPEVPQWRQQPGMSEAAQSAFIARFRPDSRGVGFAVLGGAFAEGIDLPGERLIGAFVATLGMPPVSAAQERRGHGWTRCSVPATTTPTSTPGCRRWCRPRAVSSGVRTIAAPSCCWTIAMPAPRFARCCPRGGRWRRPGQRHRNLHCPPREGTAHALHHRHRDAGPAGGAPAHRRTGHLPEAAVPRRKSPWRRHERADAAGHALPRRP